MKKNKENCGVSTPRQIIDKIKKQTKPKFWSKGLRDWYVAEITDLVRYNLKIQNKSREKEILEKIIKFVENESGKSGRKEIINYLKKLLQ